MDANIIGCKIAELRKKRNITQQQLAEEISVSDKAISKWETGGGLPDISNLIPLALALESSVDEIISDNPLGSEDNQDDCDNRDECDNQDIKQHIKIPLPFVIGAAGITLLSLLVAVVSLLLMLSTSPTYMSLEAAPEQGAVDRSVTPSIHNEDNIDALEGFSANFGRPSRHPLQGVEGGIGTPEDPFAPTSILHNGRIFSGDVTADVGHYLLLSVVSTSPSGIHASLTDADEIIWFSNDTRVINITPTNEAETTARLDIVGPGVATLFVSVNGIQAQSTIRVRDADTEYYDHNPDMISPTLPDVEDGAYLVLESVAITMPSGVRAPDVTTDIGHSFPLSVMGSISPLEPAIPLYFFEFESVEWLSSDTDVFTVTPTNASNTEVQIRPTGRGTAYLYVYVDGILSHTVVRVRL